MKPLFKLLTLSLAYLMFTASGFAKVADNKNISKVNVDQIPSPAELGESEIINSLDDLNLKAVQEAFDKSKNSDNVIYFNYHAGLTAKVRLRVGMRSLISLDKSEVIKSYLVGNHNVFKVSPIASKAHKSGVIPNLLTVKPLYPGADTNLTVITNSDRVYNFYLRSDPTDSKHVPHLTVYITLNHQDGLNNFAEDNPKTEENRYQFFFLQKESSGDYLKQISQLKPNTNYKIYGDAEIAPFAVYDDGAFTYFDFRHKLPSDRLPVIYKVVDKFDTIVNFRTTGGFLIAESVSTEGWTLKNSAKTACVKQTKHKTIKPVQME